MEGRGFTPSEFMELYGDDLVEPVKANGWAPETLEAALTVEAAQVAWEDADRTVGQLVRKLSRAPTAPAVPGQVVQIPTKRAADSEAALAAATADRDEAGERLVAARVRHHDLVTRDADRRRLAEFEAGQAEQERRRREAREQAGERGRGALARLFGGGGQS